jgi:hypothetical protein
LFFDVQDKMAERAGIEPTWPACASHNGFEDRGDHQIPITFHQQPVCGIHTRIAAEVHARTSGRDAVLHPPVVAEKNGRTYTPHPSRQKQKRETNPMNIRTPATWLVTAMLIWAVGTPIVKGG